METLTDRIREINKSLLFWYPFQPNSVVLYVGSEDDAYAEFLEGKVAKVYYTNCEECSKKEWVQKFRAFFDYIVCIEVIEKYQNPIEIFRNFQVVIKPEGHLLLGLNNRLGIRYFCGDRDPYTERVFDGVENYQRVYFEKYDSFTGRMYSRSEIKAMLENADWNRFQFFSVFPDLKNATMIYSEKFLPNEDLTSRIKPVYHNPKTVFLQEEMLYNTLVENKMFHSMANAYFIECTQQGDLSHVLHVTSSAERGKYDAFLTMIYDDNTVEKRAIYSDAEIRIQQLDHNIRELKKQGIPVVEGTLQNHAYRMPFIDASNGQTYLRKIFFQDQTQFIKLMDHFRDLILQSSKIVKEDQGDGEGAILTKGYWDMIPLNSFYQDGTFRFYDQEFCEENYPANAIILRMVSSFYGRNTLLENHFSQDILLERYNLLKYKDRWQAKNKEFLMNLRKEKELKIYHEQNRANIKWIHSNRERMNFADWEYQRTFIDIFRNADTRKLILFGSGQFAKQFIELYGKDYPVYAIIDNNQEKWGQKLDGILIQSPDLLKTLDYGEYKVIICIKKYVSVLEQLKKLGVTEYSIFDAYKDYPRKRKPIVTSANHTEVTRSKKYHTGYIAGVFDLFHIGHLNMFKRAKEQCDYLIVGVVTDEGVRKFKQTEPFIPYEERVEIVKACRYVDEVVEIPFHYGSTKDAWRMHHFDCQFSGSDYINTPRWLENKAFLEENGAEMVFFPYTEQTSSSKIKELIQRHLL